MLRNRVDNRAMENAPHGMFESPNGILTALRREQREASMLRSLGESMGGVEFTPKSLPLPGGGVMEIDGFSRRANTVCGVCDNEGDLTEAEAEMLMLSAFKLRYAAQILGNTARRILLFRSEKVARNFCGRERVQQAMGDDLSLEVCVVSPAAA